MPITFLTWNIKEKDCLQPLKEILSDFQVDILLLNESLLDDVQIYQETGLKRVISSHKRCKFYSKLPDAVFYLHNDTISEYILFMCLKIKNDITLRLILKIRLIFIYGGMSTANLDKITFCLSYKEK